MSRIRCAVLGTVVMMIVLAGAGSAYAVPAPAAPDQSTPVMVVLDASGSMLQADAPGPRIDAARNAVTDLVAALPADTRIGLTVYGTGTGSGAADKAAGCQDIQQLIPVQPVDRAAFGQAVTGIRASGYTPIGRSLQLAAQALPAEGPRSVVLVSDGEDTCAPPEPCEVAKQLKAAGTDLVLHTIGFKVDPAARAQLSCIAAATGGTYREANNGAALGSVLANRVARAIKPYTAVGTPIRGGAVPADAPPIEPGQYLDTYENGGSGSGEKGTVKYYAVRLRDGDTPHFSATVAPPGVRAENISSLGVITTLVDVADRPCIGVNGFDNAVAVFGKLIPQTAVLTPSPVGGAGWPDYCPAGSTVYLKVARTGDASRTVPLPVEIAFRVEPAVSSPGPPAATERPGALPVPADATAQPAEAGFSFNDAPVLAPGTYSASMVSGETRYYRVHLGWGQRLAYRMTVPAQAGVGFQSAAVYITLASPLRAECDQPIDSKSYQLIGGSEDQTMTGSSAAPVRWANRDAPQPYLAPYSVDGDYYLVLDASYPLGRPAFTMPFRLTVVADGMVEPGPAYLTDPGAQSPTLTAPAEPAATAAPVSDAAEPAGESGGWVLWGTAAVAALMAAVLAVVGFRRWRRVS